MKLSSYLKIFIFVLVLFTTFVLAIKSRNHNVFKDSFVLKWNSSNDTLNSSISQDGNFGVRLIGITWNTKNDLSFLKNYVLLNKIDLTNSNSIRLLTTEGSYGSSDSLNNFIKVTFISGSGSGRIAIPINVNAMSLNERSIFYENLDHLKLGLLPHPRERSL